MGISYIHSLFYLILFAIPFRSSALQLSHRRHPHHLSNASDQEALLGFMSAITYDPFQSLSTHWNPNVSFCEWTGITCSRRRQRVVSLAVPNMGLQGTISPFLGNLSFLRELVLWNNSFHGPIPYQLGNLFRLNILDLSQNQLQGSIPPTLRRCRSLHAFVVSQNNLIGTVPAWFGNISSLVYIWLDNNNLHGSVPSELGMANKLTTIVLNSNSLTGPIPSSLSNCTHLDALDIGSNQLTGYIPALCSKNNSLTILYLGRNQLSGNIPAYLYNCTNIQAISFADNHLNGLVPMELGMANKLEDIVLSNNSLTGPIPSFLSNCTHLHELDIGSNQLTGYIPAFCSKNNSLTTLSLGINQLSGNIPAYLFNCTNLQIIDLSDNQLSGVLPMEFGKLTQLERLFISRNQLVSNSTTSLPIITALSNCSTLNFIDISHNNLIGHLPFSIGQLSIKMRVLELRGNYLSGEIPPQIGNLTNLTFLDLEVNFFTGALPSSLVMLQKLERLYIRSNNLQGNIPKEIGQLKTLGLLDLGENNLSRRIPDFVANFQQLRYLYLDHNQLSGFTNLEKCVNLLLLDLSYNKLRGHIPPEVASLANLALYFNLSNNLLHGRVPSEVSKMTMVQAIDISANQLTGFIPSALGNCKELEYLNLSRNTLEGPIPMSIDELQSLQDMDFSSNNLSSEIPMSLENLKMLSHLNFSFNKLSGEVPKGGVFKNLGAMAFIGNLGLCGPWVSLSPCSEHKHKSVLHLKIVIILIVVLVATVVSCLFMGTLWIRHRNKHILTEASASLNVGYQRISYEDIITATEEFSDANLLGVGSFGKVYKGVLNDGTSIAVKLFNLENEAAQKSFDKECKVLGRIRHRNLIRITTYYSNLQMKALIFPLMSNGSLDNWLHPDGEEESCLSLNQRLNIAIDIAQGMEYLHHHCFVQVIHCDLKPTNVLLGEDMTAYITDFGISTICFAKSDDSSLTSTHALKGSTGYIPPEYGLGVRATTKGDVYSYGIVLLQMLTGKKPTDNMFVEGITLQKWVGSSFPDQVGEVVDKGLLRRTSTIIEEDKEHNCLSRLMSVGLLCTKESPERRPNMIDIVSQLQSIKDVFLGVCISNFQSDIMHLLDSTGTTHNNIGGSRSSSSTS